MAKYLAAKASWEAANVCLQTHGGFGFACEFDVERKFRETRLYQVAPISTNLDAVLHRRARARPAALVLEVGMRPLEGITVVAMEHAIAAPFCTRQLADHGARVIKIERPGSRRLRARLRRPCARACVAFRVDQSLEGESDARCEASRGRADILAQLLRKRRRARAEPRAGRGGASGLVVRGTAGQTSATHRVRHLRLWRFGPLSRQEGVRPVDSERVRHVVDHRHARRAEQGRQLHRRHFRRHVRLQQHSAGVARARAHRPGLPHRRVAAGEHDASG